MAKGVEDLKRLVIKLIKLGYDSSEIISMVSSRNDFSSLEAYLPEVVQDTIDEFPNYGLIRSIVRSDLVIDKKGDDQLVKILDTKYKRVDFIHTQRLSKLFDPKYDIFSKIYIAEHEYLPFNYGLLIKNDNGTYSYNTYQPPKWQEDYFYSNGKNIIKKITKIPDIYKNFLTHLVGGDKKSYEYIIKWLANGIQNRNYCILTTIGKQGIGKGVLGEIMRKLFGSNNFHQGSDRVFKGTFNSQIADKRLVYIDEILITNKEEEDKLKLVVNDFIEIEKKGIDAIEKRNFANFYVSSNNMDSISLTADDRRFSIVELTDKKLTSLLKDEEIKEMFEESNIEKLAMYLWNLEIDIEEMSSVFTSERTEEVRASSLREWEDWLLFRFCKKNKGKTMDVFEVGEEIKNEFGFSTRVGRQRLKTLSEKYPDIIKVVKKNINGLQTWVVEIS